jgi:hypothetical protein
MADFSVTISDVREHWTKEEYNGYDLTHFDYYDGAVPVESSDYLGTFVNAHWIVKLAALYQLPYEINLSAVFNAREGYVIPYYSAIDRGSGIGTTYMKEAGKKFGDDRLPAFWVLNLGLEKVFHIWDNALVALHVDAYNVTNNATVLGRNAVIGPAQDRIERFLNPAVFQFGIRFEF